MTATPSSAEQGKALLVQNSLDDGWVAYLALDPAGDLFTSWAGALNFWQLLLQPDRGDWSGDSPSDVSPLSVEGGQMSVALNNLPALDLPSLRLLTVLLGVYILLIGPINYLLLRRFARLDWAWVTIPLITILFSVGSFSIGTLTRGDEVILNQISIIPLSPTGSTPAVRNYIGPLFTVTHRVQHQRAGQCTRQPAYS